MAWCRQAASHYLNQCWPRSSTPHGFTRPQWVDIIQFWNKKPNLMMADFHNDHLSTELQLNDLLLVFILFQIQCNLLIRTLLCSLVSEMYYHSNIYIYIFIINIYTVYKLHMLGRINFHFPHCHSFIIHYAVSQNDLSNYLLSIPFDVLNAQCSNLINSPILPVTIAVTVTKPYILVLQLYMS